MKKRIVALLIAGTMALSLSACGGGSSSDKSDSKQNETTQEAKKEEEKAPVDLTGTWKSEDNDVFTDGGCYCRRYNYCQLGI